MIILELRLFCKMIGVKGICLWPFIIVNNKKDKVLVQHETIHYHQAKELWVIGFYWLYMKFYFQNRRNYKGHPSVKHFWCYRNIPFEKEAFAFQSQSDYLQRRKPMFWKNYK